MATMAISKRDGSFLPTSWKKFFVSISKTTLRIWTEFVCFQEITNSDIPHTESNCRERFNLKHFKEIVVSPASSYSSTIFFIGVKNLKNCSSVISLSSCKRWVGYNVWPNILEAGYIGIVDSNLEVAIFCSEFFQSRVSELDNFLIAL